MTTEATPPTPILTVNSALFWLAAQFRSLEPSFEAIHCIHVSPHPEKGVYITALNGHMFGMAYDETGEASEPLVLRVTKETLNRIKPRRVGKTAKPNAPCTLRLVDFDGKPHLAVYDGWEKPVHIQFGDPAVTKYPYPDFWNFVRKFSGCTAPTPHVPVLPMGGLDHFIKAVDVYRNAFSAPPRSMCIYPAQGIEGPVGLRFDCVPGFLGIIMPMKMVDIEECQDSTDSNAISAYTKFRSPSWLKEPVPAPAPPVTAAAAMSDDALNAGADAEHPEVAHAA